MTCQPYSFGVDGYLLRPMAPRYTRREFSALERGLLRLLEEAGLIGQGGAPDLTELGGVFLRQCVADGHFPDDIFHGAVQRRPLPIVGGEG